MKIEEGKFYFIKDEFFNFLDENKLCFNKKEDNKRQCYYCFKENEKSNILWFLPISSKVEKGYRNLVFPDIIKILKILINNNV